MFKNDAYAGWVSVKGKGEFYQLAADECIYACDCGKPARKVATVEIAGLEKSTYYFCDMCLRKWALENIGIDRCDEVLCVQK